MRTTISLPSLAKTEAGNTIRQRTISSTKRPRAVQNTAGQGWRPAADLPRFRLISRMIASFVLHQLLADVVVCQTSLKDSAFSRTALRGLYAVLSSFALLRADRTEHRSL
jgi:hypothetical protein